MSLGRNQTFFQEMKLQSNAFSENKKLMKSDQMAHQISQFRKYTFSETPTLAPYKNQLLNSVTCEIGQILELNV